MMANTSSSSDHHRPSSRMHPHPPLCPPSPPPSPLSSTHHNHHKSTSPSRRLSLQPPHLPLRPLLIIAASFLLLLQPAPLTATHITGTYRPQREFFRFLVKFGFQQTEPHAPADTYGYIYGNVTSPDAFPVPLTLAVLDRQRFLRLYENRFVYDKNVACQLMFSDVQRSAYDKQCNPTAKGDFLRRVPCPHGQLCVDEDDARHVVPGSQFTYVISNLVEPSFWYVALVACYRDPATCQWRHYDAADPVWQTNTSTSAATPPSAIHAARSPAPPAAINYDFHLVQGDPIRPGASSLHLQFSFDQQYILEMNLVFFCVYVLLVPLQLYAVRIQRHPVTRLFTLSLVLEMVSLVLILWHQVRFAASGEGNEVAQTTGEVLDIFSRTSFMLILLLLAKGWAVTRQQVSRQGWMILLAIWVPYCAFHVVLYVWNRTEVDIISDIDEYQTWPGLLVLACRTAFMLWFLWELRSTMKYEHSSKKLDFLLHFGASSLVWFIYLPVVAIIALQVSPMWRCKLLLGITNSADCLAYCVMTGLLWPNRSGQYLLLAGTNYSGMDELDELNEAPNIVRGDVNLPHANLHTDAAPVVVVRPGTSPLRTQHAAVHDHGMLERHDYVDDFDDEDDEDVVLSTDDLLRRSAAQHVPNGGGGGGGAMQLHGHSSSPHRSAGASTTSNGDLGTHRNGGSQPHDVLHT